MRTPPQIICTYINLLAKDSEKKKQNKAELTCNTWRSCVIRVRLFSRENFDIATKLSVCFYPLLFLWS